MGVQTGGTTSAGHDGLSTSALFLGVGVGGGTTSAGHDGLSTSAAFFLVGGGGTTSAGHDGLWTGALRRLWFRFLIPASSAFNRSRIKMRLRRASSSAFRMSIIAVFGHGTYASLKRRDAIRLIKQIKQIN